MLSRARSFVAILGALTVAGALLASPASARPGQVRPPHVKASSPHSLTLTWPAKGGVSRYEVFWATSYAGVKKSSARSRKTSGRQTSLKVTGLKANQMYCFMVRGLSGGSAGNRSERHCKLTMRSANKTSRSTVSIVTFNLCAVANGCHSWSTSRENAIVNRVREAYADVVAVQEGSGKIGTVDRPGRLTRRLDAIGFSLASATTTEGVFFRRSHLAAMTRQANEACTPGTRRYTGNTSGWETADGTHTSASGRVYTYVQPTADDPEGYWTYQQVCTRVPDAGQIDLGHSKSSAWARLRVKKTGRSYVFASVHLLSGKGSGASKVRDAQTKTLITKARRAAHGTPIVFAGDFNSTRNRPNDSPRLRLARSGWFDAYDRSATYSRPNFNSYNGWRTRPTTSVRYGDHVDRIFITNDMGSTGWRVVVSMRGSKYRTPIASDHSPVRTTLYLR